MVVRNRIRVAKPEKNARAIAKVVYGCLEELPEEEIQERMKAIQKVKITSGNTSKRGSTQGSLRARSRALGVRRRRARP